MIFFSVDYKKLRSETLTGNTRVTFLCNDFSCKRLPRFPVNENQLNQILFCRYIYGASAGLGQFHTQTNQLRRRKMAFLFRALLFLGVFTAGESNLIFDCKKKGDHHCSGRGQKLAESLISLFFLFLSSGALFDLQPLCTWKIGIGLSDWRKRHLW